MRPNPPLDHATTRRCRHDATCQLSYNNFAEPTFKNGDNTSVTVHLDNSAGEIPTKIVQK